MRICFSVVLLLFALAPAVGRAADDFRVTAATGNAAIWPAGADAPSPAIAGLPLNPGDRLVTGAGGTLEVGAANGSILQLQENSSFSVEPPTSRWTAFRLGLGRLVAKFAPSPARPYRVATPVAVAAIRGTELMMDVGDTGALQAGVVEGEVGFAPLTEADAPAVAPEAEVLVSTSEGLVAVPNRRPKKLAEIPPLLRPSLAAFPSLRARVPRLRDTWTDLAPSRREALRRDAFRARIRWEIPARVRDRLVAPALRIAPASVPDRPAVAPPAPPARRPAPARVRPPSGQGD